MPENIKKRNARQNTWQKENKDKFNLLLPKGRKAEIQEVAKNKGMSATEWINEAICEKLEKE